MRTTTLPDDVMMRVPLSTAAAHSLDECRREWDAARSALHEAINASPDPQAVAQTEPTDNTPALPNVRRIIRAGRLLAELGHDGDTLAALEELKSLRAALEEARKGQQWVPVGERLPEDDVQVMVYTPPRNGEDERIDFDCRDEGCWFDHNERHEHFVMVGGSRAAGPDVVCTGPDEQAPYTHWQSLPAAPSAAAGKE